MAAAGLLAPPPRGRLRLHRVGGPLWAAEKKADAYSYACPCYANPKRGGLNFIFTVDLRSEDPPQKWILRGVALLASTPRIPTPATPTATRPSSCAVTMGVMAVGEGGS
mgnify:CR=1 FL=1